MRYSFSFKALTKCLKNNPFIHRCVGFLLYALIRILFFTYRPRIHYAHDINVPIQKQDGVFYFWHQSIISGMYFFFKTRNTGACVVSPSKDGQIVGYICSKLGFSVIYGSSTKRPIELIKKTGEALTRHRRLCIVGDGSRGPAFHLQRGVHYLAVKHQAPIIFVQCQASWKITFKNSWDQFQIPLPFSRITINVHHPLKPT